MGSPPLLLPLPGALPPLVITHCPPPPLLPLSRAGAAATAMTGSISTAVPTTTTTTIPGQYPGPHPTPSRARTQSPARLAYTDPLAVTCQAAAYAQPSQTAPAQQQSTPPRPSRPPTTRPPPLTTTTITRPSPPPPLLIFQLSAIYTRPGNAGITRCWAGGGVWWGKCSWPAECGCMYVRSSSPRCVCRRKSSIVVSPSAMARH
eukprot:XP_001700504.1 predicted protein [Chlamydomonas reinhardtii]